MDLHVSVGGRGDRTARIYLTLRAAVLDGRLVAGDRVPSTRDLAVQLGVARGTVSVAYDRLVAEGFLESRPGAGTFVTTVPLTAPDGRERRARPGAVQPLDLWDRPPAPPQGRGRVLHDLGIGLPDPALFPLAQWRREVARQLRRSRLAEATYAGRGVWRLQAEIARLLGLTRSVAAAGEDVIVTAGAQQAVDLVARVLLEPGATVAVEDPGYAAVGRLLETHRADVRGIPVDAEGLVVDALPPDARLVYVTPSHQFPTGIPMSLRRRVALLSWAVEHDAVVVEDDYDSEFRFSDQPVEPLQSLDREGRVVYVGTFSKSLLPALRTGFLVAPRSLQPGLREAKRVTTWEGDATTQGALAEFLAEGHHAAHVRRAGRVYAERRGLMLAGLGELDDVLRVVPSVAGLHVCALFRDPQTDDRAVVARAAARGVRVEALSTHFREQPPRAGLVLGFGGVDAQAIPDALRRLVEVVRPGVRQETSTGSAGV
ncbi:PLP-dependent aminotransferase family protein [Nocardioides cynanchi]|uniref:MocR-like pyridoxine biosynthesis transcription factor PdxR n=1 Tax=Nocardioides cynanchi TaxID=2558918 RepID=UPI0012482A9C|nr:PLP-dependent aminotransferase family protein [Nocardioides cynanchi]